jgi:RND family efflux transporter MFP subunit
VGALVGYGGPTKLATIVQLDPIYVYFNVDEQSVLRIKQRLAAQHRTIADVGVIPIDVGTQTEDGYPHHGKLDYVAPQVDTSTGTLTVRGVFENKDRSLLPGLFVRVRVPEERVADAVLIADTALGNDQRGRYVLVLGADDLVEQRVVKVGQLEGSLRIVEDGLHPDDWVVVGGIQRAIPGSKVAPQRITMHGAPTEPAAPAAPVASTTEAAPAPAAAAAKP